MICENPDNERACEQDEFNVLLHNQLSSASSEDSVSCSVSGRSLTIIRKSSGEIIEPGAVSLSNITSEIMPY